MNAFCLEERVTFVRKTGRYFIFAPEGVFQYRRPILFFTLRCPLGPALLFC